MSATRSTSRCAHPDSLVMVASIPLCFVGELEKSLLDDALLEEELLSLSLCLADSYSQAACERIGTWDPLIDAILLDYLSEEGQAGHWRCTQPECGPALGAAIMPCDQALGLVGEVCHVAF